MPISVTHTHTHTFLSLKDDQKNTNTQLYLIFDEHELEPLTKEQLTEFPQIVIVQNSTKHSRKSTKFKTFNDPIHFTGITVCSFNGYYAGK